MTETVHTQTPHIEDPQLQAPPAGTAYSAPGRPPLQRDRTDLLVGGVAAGLARHTGIDALLWRLGFVGLTFAGGAGFFLYLALWLLMPTAPARPEDRTNLLDGWVERLRTPFTRRRAG